MPLIKDLIVNADDFGLKQTVNSAILYCFEQEYINSKSLLTNFEAFDEAVDMARTNPAIQNMGIHVNFAEGKPLTNFKYFNYLDENGNWDIQKTGKKLSWLSSTVKAAFANELKAQLDKALAADIPVTHFDSHLHLHTLPSFFDIFLNAARIYKLKLRLAQTYYEGSYIKYYYRKYINSKIIGENLNYSGLFLTVDEFLQNKANLPAGIKEIMVHPDYDASGRLTDHTDVTSVERWIGFYKQGSS